LAINFAANSTLFGNIWRFLTILKADYEVFGRSKAD